MSGHAGFLSLAVCPGAKVYDLSGFNVCVPGSVAQLIFPEVKYTEEEISCEQQLIFRTAGHVNDGTRVAIP